MAVTVLHYPTSVAVLQWQLSIWPQVDVLFPCAYCGVLQAPGGVGGE
jgi:hypothetical protein